MHCRSRPSQLVASALTSCCWPWSDVNDIHRKITEDSFRIKNIRQNALNSTFCIPYLSTQVDRPAVLYVSRLSTVRRRCYVVSTVFVVITMGTAIDTDPAETATSPGPMWKALFVDSGMKFIYSSMHNRSTDLVHIRTGFNTKDEG